jgi:hypothetical protein
MAIIHNNNKIPKLQPKKRIKKTSLPLYPYKYSLVRQQLLPPDFSHKFNFAIGTIS